MADRILLLLPTAPAASDATAYWWRLSDDALVAHGGDAAWRALVAPPVGGPGLPLIALAPSASVSLSWPKPTGETEQQRIGIARADAVRGGMADPATLHAVAGVIEGNLAVALVANGTMVEWLDWLTLQGADPEAIVPSALLLARSECWTAAVIGSDRMIGCGDVVAPDEPAFRDVLVRGEEVTALSAAEIEKRLVLLAATRPLNLRTGRFARRRLLVLDWGRVRELAALFLLIPLLGLVMALVTLGRLNQSTDRLEAETARLASAAVGERVTSAAAAGALDARIETAGAGLSPFPPLAALYQQLQAVPGARMTSAGYRPDGTLTASVSASRVEELNRVLIALQRSGYRVTATTRSGPGGQMLADISVRGVE